jgi:hypothetical protein
VVCIIGTVFFLRKGYPLYNNQVKDIKIRKFFDQHLKNNEVGGYSDNGYVGYYCKSRIINLDGVVNNKVFQSIKKGNLLKLMRDYKIKYFVLKKSLFSEKFLGQNYKEQIELFSPALNVWKIKY